MDPNQRKLFEILKNPVLSFKKVGRKSSVASSLSTEDNERHLDKYSLIKILNHFQKLSEENKLSSIDSRLLQLIDKSVHEFIKI